MSNFATPIGRRALVQGLGATAAAAASPVRAGQAGDPVAETRAGKVRGFNQGPLKVFRGIRYGADTATTRSMPPAPPKPWAGVAEAKTFGPKTPQFESSGGATAALLSTWATPETMSEDCLVLNIWTPGLRDKKRPVMFWIHGGGFANGSGARLGYDGSRLSQRGDVVVVTVNHRLNIFGYLGLAEVGGAAYADSGNAGQHDLIAALRWVRDNIAEFGGDPNNVMIFGESGGGAKTSALLAMPAAKGLFHRAAVQSGPLLRGVPQTRATATVRRVLSDLGAGPNDVAALRNAPMDKLLAVYAKLGPMSQSLSPVVDGRGLPNHPFDPAAPSASRDVPLLIGTCRTETTFVFNGDKYFNMSWEALPTLMQPYMAKASSGDIVAAYRKLMPAAAPADIFYDVLTKIMMERNTVTLAERKAALGAAPAYVYELTWATPVHGGVWRSPHTLDIPFIFDDLGHSPNLAGTGPDSQAMADLMSEAWIAFARSGNPQTKALPTWPKYDAKRRATMQFDLPPKLADNPAGPALDILRDTMFWDMTA
ncbi:MAG: carboxylesterase/lipase family protein [Caulobacteraceae bacterium]